MNAEHPPEFSVRTWTGDQTGWPETALEQGPVRISGTVVDGNASWHAARDRLGWTTVVLLAGTAGSQRTTAMATEVVRFAASCCADPLRTAQAVHERLGPNASNTELAVLRIAPHGLLVELINVSLPLVLHWDPQDGLAPFEPVASGVRQISSRIRTEMIRLRPGACIIGATCGVLGHDAGWGELNAFVSAMAIDRLGGFIADAPSQELGHLLCSSWPGSPGPCALVAVGLPPDAVCAA